MQAGTPANKPISIMRIEKSVIAAHNEKELESHREQFSFLGSQLEKKNVNTEQIIQKLIDFQIAIPSWALGAGATRFGRFSIGGEPSTLADKINDVGIIHALTKAAGAISLHIPWDIPEDTEAIKELAATYDIVFDAVNSNTFQDQADQEYSYKFGSLSHVDERVRRQAITHNLKVIEYGKALGSTSITVWLADGASFPGQANFRIALQHVQASLQEIHAALPDDWRMLIEYKPYEPNFYSMVIPDWGTSLLLAEGCGEKASCLVDLGHHLPNTNIEQIVATLLMKGKLGGFHFNDSKYGDDDLTVGSIRPYQLFLIFNELVVGIDKSNGSYPPPAWMIDASHNLKDPLEDLIQSLEGIRIAYVQAMLINHAELESAQQEYNVVVCQQILQDAFRTDVRPIIREARLRAGGSISPLDLYREADTRGHLIKERGMKSIASGL